MPFRKDQKRWTGTGNLKGDQEIVTVTSSKTGTDVEKKNFLDMTALIRSIQRAEGHADCFQKGIIDCDQIDCKWRSFCLKEQPVKY
ncbi:MAG: hypothetical protein PVJ06_03240 [Desulfobacterales bacterium]|jgi:hypothetical protein